MERTRSLTRPKRGDVYLVSFDPTVGSEIKKTRPALVIQNDIGNKHSPLTIVAAITSKADSHSYPTEVFVQPPEGGLREPSLVLLNQVRTIDKQRLIAHLGRLSPARMKLIDRALSISIGLMEL
jgi:mRNA interferase MazF